MLTGGWSLVATPGMALLVGAILVICLIRAGYHVTPEGILGRRKMASVFILGASTYTFVVLVISQLVMNGPHLSILCEAGFGNSRIAYLLIGVILDGIFHLWEEFRQAANS